VGGEKAAEERVKWWSRGGGGGGGRRTVKVLKRRYGALKNRNVRMQKGWGSIEKGVRARSAEAKR